MPVKTGMPEPGLERGAGRLGDLVQRVRLLDPEPPVARDEILEVLGRDRPAAADVGVVGRHVLEPVRRPVRHQDDRRAHAGHAGGLLVHERAQPAEHVGIGVGHDAVAEVEDVARPAGRAREHVERRRLDPLPRPEEDGAVEVALHAAVVADLLPAPVERDPPVEPDHVAARVAHLLEQRRRAGAEVDRRAVDRGEDARRVRLHELLVVLRRERSDPRVEELDHVGARAHLRPDVAGEGVRELLHQRVPRRRLGVHHPLDVQELAARLALDQVARRR